MKEDYRKKIKLRKVFLLLCHVPAGRGLSWLRTNKEKERKGIKRGKKKERMRMIKKEK